jgi:hypothetical protein
MRLKPLIVLAALMAALPVFPQHQAPEVITGELSEEYMKYLSSDLLEGRRTGSEGNDAAAAWISARALETGLKPLPGRDNLFQSLEYLRVTPIPEESTITLSDSSGTVLYTTAALPVMAPADTVDVSGEVVFAGYGYMNSQEKYNDFADISLNGRIVIIMTRKPNLRGSGMPDPQSGISEMSEVRKVPMIMMQKAKAILYVADPALGSDISSNLLSMGGSYQLTPLFRKQLYNFALNAYTISTTTADLILARAGLTLEQLQDSIAITGRPASFIIPDLKARVHVSVTKDTVTSNNVIGYMEGSDTLLREEAVLFSAHYDHVGKDLAGNIYNGANDNASGSVGVLNIASAFAALEKRPARSLIFFWTTGEEEGLHGSSYYAENPLWPLDMTVAAINFDMIGRSRRETDIGASANGRYDITGTDTIKVISGDDCRRLVSMAGESCKESGIHMIDEGKGDHFSGSDHYPFFRKDIPVLFFFTGLHTDYHKPSDDFEYIDFDKLIKVSKAGFLTGYKVATATERLEKDRKRQQ